uniref:Large ribosomal subunit protein uL13 n=1 Tax=Ignisphaera aggregans TaxID=334771 RepID=A0A7J3QG19_9CREN
MSNVYEVSLKDLYEILADVKDKEIVIDAENALLGRLASCVAKLLLMGFRVHVVNIEKALVSGDKRMVIESYKLLLNVKTHRNPYKQSMKRPRNPIAIFKSSIKRMLPKHNWRGKMLLKSVKAYIGMPKEFSGKRIIKIAEVNAEKLGRESVISVLEIAKALGWRGVE